MNSFALYAPSLPPKRHMTFFREQIELRVAPKFGFPLVTRINQDFTDSFNRRLLKKKKHMQRMEWG